MKTLNISISDNDYSQLGVGSDSLTFSEFLEIVSKALIKQNLDKCLELASKYGLSKMSIEDITSDVKAMRADEKISYRY